MTERSPLVLDLVPGRAVRMVEAGAPLVAACALIAAPLAWEWRALALAVLLAAWRAGPVRSRAGCLVVRPGGHVTLHRPGVPLREGSCLPASWVGSGWVVMRVRWAAGDGAVAVSRKRLPAADWRRLRAWLRYPPWRVDDLPPA